MSERTLDRLFERIYHLEGVLAQARQLIKSEMDECSFTDVKLHKILRRLLGVLDKTILPQHPENGEEKQ
jgi:hypothetical protein